MIELQQVSKSFGKVEALRMVDLHLKEGEQYAIRGPSGSGKSTLLYLLGGLDRPSHGKIYVGDKEITNLKDSELALFRNQYVGFVFQFHFLLSSINCLKNILLPAQIGLMDVKPIKEQALDLAERLGVTHCLQKFPYELSGGEQQRINIIRALSLRPKLLLCDEPTGNLDSANGRKVTLILKELAEKYNSTLIVVTHNEEVASHFTQQFTIVDGTFH